MDPAPFEAYQYANYGHFVSHLKNNLFPTGPGSYYISGAPQCIVPDARESYCCTTLDRADLYRPRRCYQHLEL
jgi:hypothetical protein